MLLRKKAIVRFLCNVGFFAVDCAKREIVHNLGMVSQDQIDAFGYVYDGPIEANEKMKKYIMNNDLQALINNESQGNAFDLAIPTSEYYLQLLYSLALKEGNEKITLFNG